MRIEEMTVNQLKTELKRRDLIPRGSKADFSEVIVRCVTARSF